MIEYMHNGKWIELNKIRAWSITTETKLPYMGEGTKWKYFIMSCSPLKGCNIIRSDEKKQPFKYKTLKLKELEGVEKNGKNV